MADIIQGRAALQQALGVGYSSLDERLRDKVAIVTGAAQGIGRAIARRMAWEGCDLVLTDLESERENLDQLSRDARAAGVKVQVVLGDATRKDSVEEVCRKAIEHFGRIDVLVNNVGGGVLIPFLQKTEEMWRHELELNLVTFIRYCQMVVPHMVERRYGRIVNVGAESVRNGLWEHVTYSAAKGGMHGMTPGLARELAPYSITVNTVAPSITMTEKVQQVFAENPNNIGVKYVNLIPLGRPATMGEVAATVAFLASDDASFITGQVISVNGGSSML